MKFMNCEKSINHFRLEFSEKISVVNTSVIVSSDVQCEHHKNKVEEAPSILQTKTLEIQIADTNADINKVTATDYKFLSDSVFHGQKEILKYYTKKYNPDSCHPLQHDKADLIRHFEGLFKLGNIREKRTSSIFVLDPFNYCKFENEESFDGQAYYFTDTTLPRLQT